MKENNYKTIENEYVKFFDSKKLYNNLALSALYLATFELLKSAIIMNIRSFFSRSEICIENEMPVRYQEVMKVYFEHRSKKDKEYISCCDWLKDMEAINNEDFDHLISIKEQRNTIAHELPSLLIEPQKDIDVRLLVKAKELIGKIDRFWIMNFGSVK